MSNDWFRSWHGAPTDPKWLLIAKRANVRPIHVIGTWWALLDYASQHPERGSIVGFDIETFALFAGLEDEHVSRIVTTLRDKGMLTGEHITQWLKRQPKREDETAAERKRRSREAGKGNGGKPPPSGNRDTPDHTLNGSGHAMSRDVTPEEDEKREDRTIAKAMGTVVPHPAADFAKVVFDSGVTLLVNSDTTERQARSMIGRWRKSYSDPAVLDVLRRAEIGQVSNPLEWITKALEATNERTASGSAAGRVARVVNAGHDFIADGGSF